MAAYALDALDEAERRDTAARIAADPKLRRELEAWRETAAQLAHVAPVAEPAPELRANILAAIKNVKQDAVPRRENNCEDNENIGEDNEIESNKIVAKPNVVAFPNRAARRTFSSYVPIVGAIAASIVAVLLGVALANSAAQLRGARREIAALNQRVGDAEQKLNDTTARLERERQERELLGSPNSVVRALNGTKEMPTAKARLVFDRQTGRALLFVENLPDAPEGKAYQIWWITDPNQPAPGGTFKTAANGKGELRDLIPQQYTSAPIFAVTLEPETGSPKPTTTPVLITSVS